MHRHLNRLVVILVILMAGALNAWAQTGYPQRPIRIIVAFTAGSGNDVIARDLAQLLFPILGQPVIVENKVGAGGIIAFDTVAKASARWLHAWNSARVRQLVMNIGLRDDLPFSVDRDLTTIRLSHAHAIGRDCKR